MTPHNGSGANQAIEDAYLLGRLLTQPFATLDNVHLLLAAYDSVCRPRAQAVAKVSRELGLLGEFGADIEVAEGEDEESVVAEKLLTIANWIGEGDVEDDVARAVDILRNDQLQQTA
ncbi:hypothetical protein EXIGLDRAFT_772967 [Exidia glandulosa HHB12029]|uniref:FAD-binding domain-containing protein n=1 Tax=Exidia glandulosa HHB12029 TaxID=1314781 RepID=A0A165F1G8_EXIGL|nr:hypothetical protein EXIGLDRAFT_772967 [Exidia glandulosa HHB12029]